jgi:hypothetical protein
VAQATLVETPAIGVASPLPAASVLGGILALDLEGMGRAWQEMRHSTWRWLLPNVEALAAASPSGDQELRMGSRSSARR